MDLALNNLQWLMCNKTKPNPTKTKQTKNIFLKTLKMTRTTPIDLTAYQPVKSYFMR